VCDDESNVAVGNTGWSIDGGTGAVWPIIDRPNRGSSTVPVLVDYSLQYRRRMSPPGYHCVSWVVDEVERLSQLC